MKTQPLPPIGQDPSILGAQQIARDFVAGAQTIRENFSLNDLASAEAVVALWEQGNTKIADLFQNLQARRNARIAELDTLVPLGPSIPADASPADVAVLQQAFRTALAEARTRLPDQAVWSDGNITPIGTRNDTLDAMLADAETFDDDNLRRAVLTAAVEGGHMRIVRQWTDQMGCTAELEELEELRAAVSGGGIYGLWNMQTFGTIKPIPPEVDALPQLRALAEAANRQRASAAVNTRTSSGLNGF